MKKVHVPHHGIPDPPKAVAEGQRVAAAVDLTGQAHAMPEFKAGRVWPPDGIDSDRHCIDSFLETWRLLISNGLERVEDAFFFGTD